MEGNDIQGGGDTMFDASIFEATIFLGGKKFQLFFKKIANFFSDLDRVLKVF